MRTTEVNGIKEEVDHQLKKEPKEHHQGASPGSAQTAQQQGAAMP